MKLIRVEIDGFKSFAKYTEIKFDGSIVGIVGPNGSGKSNINDAIRWVLSSTSNKGLRASSTKDIIFAGNKQHPPATSCYVVLVFDNSEKKISVDADIVAIKREFQRKTLSSTYYINNQVVQQQQVKMIASEIGVFRSSLAVISQGSILSLVEANPQEKKVFFEETAKVSKYKLQKTLILQKLTKIEQELEKAGKVLKEKKKLLAVLQEQAQSAALFKQLSQEIADIELPFFKEQYLHTQHLLSLIRIKLQESQRVKHEVSCDTNTLKGLAPQLTQKLEELQKAEEKVKEETTQKSEQVHSLKNMIYKVELKKQAFAWGLEEEELKDEDEVQEEIAQKSQEVDKLRTRLQTLEAKHTTLSKKEEVITAQIAHLNNSINTLFEELTVSTIRLDSLRNYVRKNKPVFPGVKTILENKNTLSGIIGTLEEILEFDVSLDAAFKAAMGSKTQTILTKTTQNIQEAIDFLKSNNGGKATFIALNDVRPKLIKYSDKEYLLNNFPIIGIGEDLIKCDSEYQQVKNFYLGSVIFCQSLKAALYTSKALRFKYTVVTLEGDIVRTNGEVFGGSDAKKTDGKYSKQIQELAERIRVNKDAIKKSKESLQVLSQSHKEVRVELFTLPAQISATKISLVELNTLIASLQKELEWIQKEAANNEMSMSVSELQEKFDTLSEDLDNHLLVAKSIFQEVEHARSSLLGTLQDISKNEEKLRELIKNEGELRLEEQRMETQLKDIEEQLRTKYDMSPKQLLSTVFSSKANSTQKPAQILEQLKAKLAKLKVTKFDSYEELNSLTEEYQQKSAVKKELEAAYVQIKAKITDFDNKIIDRMNATIKLVNSAFNLTFIEMFGGGQAEIFYSDPEDVINSGIDVKVQLPGKQVKSIQLYSGGEKSLIMIALLFSILHSYPLPFCIFDEVEAALDETNLLRFVEFLKKLKHTTQFIVITHRHTTMMNMDQLLGVTMQAPGVSSLFSVKLEQAQSMVEDEL